MDMNLRIRFLVYKLSLGTPYYQGGLRSKGCDMDLVLKDHKQNQREICVTQNPQRSSREWECELSPDSPDFSPKCPGVRSIRAISRSIRVTFAQRLLSSVRSINTPLTPSVTLSLAHFEPEQNLTLEQALLLPPFDFWEISWGIQVRDLQEKRFELVSIHFNPWALVFRWAHGFKSITLGALSS